MKANELRIGNWVTLDGKEIQIVFINSTNFHQLFQPIPLTKEWLLMFGLKKEFGEYTLTDSYWRIGVDRDFNVSVMGEYHLCKCEYVHQLQNLYFALTGEELEIKKPSQH